VNNDYQHQRTESDIRWHSCALSAVALCHGWSL